MNKNCIFVVLLLTVGVYSYSALYDTCGNDGFYQCTYPVAYNWEAPTSSATQYDNNQACYGIMTTLPFQPKMYGDNVYYEFDCDLIIRSYNGAPGGTYSSVTMMYSGYTQAGSMRYLEIKGTSPNRRAIYTWSNFRHQSGITITGQIKVFENGNFEVHVNSFNYKLGITYSFLGLEHYPNGNSDVNWPIYTLHTGNYSGLAWGFYNVPPPPPPPTQVCGNGIIEGTEQCDGGVCCNNCSFSASSSVCRPATGFCDLAEYCTGASSTCPADSFKPSTTPCNEDFGICDVRLARTCTGNSGACSGLSIPVLSTGTLPWLGYNVISFGDFNADSGSVGGRLAVKGNTVITSGFSVGYNIDLTIQAPKPGQSTSNPVLYSFVGGHNVQWADGTIDPNNFEFGYAGDSFIGAPGLATRFIGSNKNGSNLDGYFANAQAYYTALSGNLALEAANAQAVSKYGGLFFSCNDNSGKYVANVDASLFNVATWYSVDNTCAYGATWVINVGGNADLTFQGGDFPGVGERVLYNVLGSGRTVNVASRVNGNILAPKNNYLQSGGVTVGLVIVGNINTLSSASLPSCTDLQPFDIVIAVQQNAQAGSSNIQVPTFSQMIAGDSFIVTGDSTAYTISARNEDGQGGYNMDITPALASNIEVGSFLTATVTDPSAARPQDKINIDNSANSAFALAASFVAIFIALLI